MKKNILLSLAIIAIILVVLLVIFKGTLSERLFSTPTPKTLTKITVAYTSVASSKPEMAVAYKNKLFQKYGLDVHITEFSSGDLLARSLIGGKVDLVIVGQDTYLKAAAAGSDIKSIGLVNSNTRWYFVARKDIKDIKTYCTIGITTQDYLRGTNVLKKLGYDIKKLDIVNLASTNVCLDALESNKVDSMAVSEVAWENFKMHNKDAANYKVIIKAFGNGYLTSPAAIIVTANTLKNKKQSLENFSKAVIEANYWLKTHSESQIEIEIVGLANITPNDAKIYAKIIDSQLEGIKFTQDLSNLEDIKVANENVSPKLKDFDVKNFLSTQISDDLQKQKFLQKYGF